MIRSRQGMRWAAFAVTFAVATGAIFVAIDRFAQQPEKRVATPPVAGKEIAAPTPQATAATSDKAKARATADCPAGGAASKLAMKTEHATSPKGAGAVPTAPDAAETGPDEVLGCMIAEGRILEQRDMPVAADTEASHIQKVKRLMVVETDFKYPRLRVEETVERDTVTGRERIVAQRATVADHVVVGFNDKNTDLATAARLAESVGLRIRKKMDLPGHYILETPESGLDSIAKAIAALAGKVKYAQEDGIVTITRMPNDPLFDQLWGMHNTGQTGGTPDADIDAPEAWDSTVGSSESVVGVIDTGVDYTHPELRDNIWVNPGETPGNGIDDDGNGKIDDVHGYDFYADDGDPMDEHRHGTHCSGTIGGAGNNGIGVAGVCWNVRIMALRFLGPTGSGTLSDATDAIYYATQNGARLTSNSWGNPGGGGYSEAMKAALAHANENNVLFVCAAGNDSLDHEQTPYYPADYELDNIIVVAATDRNDALAGFSCYGRNHVDLGAPGVSILSCILNGGYDHLSGTSMATPHVAGACALLWSFMPTETAVNIKKAVLAGVDPVPSLAGKTLTGGRLNVRKSLSFVSGVQVVLPVDDDGLNGTTGNDDGVINPGETVGLYIEMQNGRNIALDDVVVTAEVVDGGAHVVCTQASVSFGNIGAGQSRRGASQIVLTVDANCPTPWPIGLRLTLTANGQTPLASLWQTKVFVSSLISGRVTKDGAPEAGVKISYVNKNAEGLTHSRSNGTYRLGAVGGDCSVIAEKSGYVATAPVLVTVPPDKANVDFEFKTVTISGRVYDEKTGDPLAGATVSYAGGTFAGKIISDANGRYSITGVFGRPLGIAVAAKLAGYFDAAPLIVTAPPDRPNTDIPMGRAAVNVAPKAFDVALRRGEWTSRTLTILNSGSRDLIWSAHVLGGGAPGSVIRKLNLPTTRFTFPTGIAYADGSLWLADKYNPFVLFRIDPIEGTVLDQLSLSIPTDLYTGADDIGSDGRRLWLMARQSGGGILSVDPNTGKLLNAFVTYGGLRADWGYGGIAAGGGSIWSWGSLSQGGYAFREYDPETFAVKREVSAPAVENFPFGTHYEDGVLWVAPDNGYHIKDKPPFYVQGIDATSGELLAEFERPNKGSMGITIDEDGHLYIVESYWGSSYGTNQCIWVLDSGLKTAVTADRTSGVLGEDEQTVITLGIDGSTAAIGDSQVTVTIRSNDPDDPEVTVPVTLHVEPGLGPRATLVTPAEGATSVRDLGYVDVRWSATGGSTIDSASIGTDDVRLSGVTVVGVTPLGGGVYRYTYTGSLRAGWQGARVSAGVVLDTAGEKNELQTMWFKVIESPDIEVSPASLSAGALSAETVNRGVQVRNVARGVLDWSAYALDGGVMPGTTVRTMNMEFFAHRFDAAYDAKHGLLWIADGATSAKTTLRGYSPQDGSLRETIPVPWNRDVWSDGNDYASIRGLAWQGDSLWVMRRVVHHFEDGGYSGENYLSRIDRNGVILQTVIIFAELEKLTYGGGYLWAIDPYGWYILKIDPASGAVAQAHAIGIERGAYNDMGIHYSETGSVLWMTATDANGQGRLFALNPDTFQVMMDIGIPQNSGWLAGGSGPRDLWMGTYNSQQARLVDIGLSSWLKATPSQGALGVGAQTLMRVSMDGVAAGTGTRNGVVKIVANDPATPVTSIPVTFTVTSTGNRSPIAVDDFAKTQPGVAATIAVLANDSDPDSDPLTLAVASAPAHGTASVVTGNKIVYSPAAGFVGEDEFFYRISDGRGGEAIGRVVVGVGAGYKGPVAVNDFTVTLQDQSVWVDVLANDTHPLGEPLTVTGVNEPRYGEAFIHDNRLLFKPAVGFSGCVQFTYRVSDSHGNTDTAVVTVRVEVDGAGLPEPWRHQDIGVPAAQFGRAAYQNGVFTIDCSGALAWNYDNGHYVYQRVSGDFEIVARVLYVEDTDIPPFNEEIAFFPEGGLVVREDLAGDSPLVSFGQIGDVKRDWFKQNNTVAARIRETRGGVISVHQGFWGDNTIKVKTIKLVRQGNTFTGYMSEDDGAKWTMLQTYTVSMAAEVYIGLVYEPSLMTQFGEGRFDRVSVSAARVPPVAKAGADRVIVDANGDGVETVTLDGSASYDKDGSIVSYAWSEGLTTVAATKQATVNLKLGSHVFELKVTDNNGSVGVDRVHISVVDRQRNVLPVAKDDEVTILQGTGASVDVLANDYDPEGTVLTLSGVDTPTHGVAAIQNGRVLYTPAGAFAGVEVFRYRVRDADGGESSAQIRVTVRGPNHVPGCLFTATPSAGNSQPLVVQLDASRSADLDGDPLTYDWDFGDGAAKNSGPVTIAHTYAKPGPYTVVLRVSDGWGAVSEARAAVSVGGLADIKATEVTFSKPAPRLQMASVGESAVATTDQGRLFRLPRPATESVVERAADMPIYHQVFIALEGEGIPSALARLGLPLEDATAVKGGIELPLSETDLARVADAGFRYEIVKTDLAAANAAGCRANMKMLYDGVMLSASGNAPTHMGYGSMGGFYTLDEIGAVLDQMHKLYPAICSEKQSMGTTGQGRPIWVVKISDNVNTDEPEGEVLFDAEHHAREPGGYTAMLYFMWYLLENYGKDPECTFLVNERELFFIPAVNPDGLAFNIASYPSGGGMWRKNRRDNGFGVYGVDVNRNYPFKWGYDNIGSSPDISDETYRGPSPASEPETTALMNFVFGRSIRTALSLHTYQGLYLYPYGYGDFSPSQIEAYRWYASKMAADNGYVAEPVYDLYPVNGSTVDWYDGAMGVFAISPEIGREDFWPSLAHIMPEAEENLPAHLLMAWGAGGLLEPVRLTIEDGQLDIGQNETLWMEVLNQGWGESQQAAVRIQTTDPYVTVIDGDAVVDPIPARGRAFNTASGFRVGIATNCPLGRIVTFTLEVDQGNGAQIARRQFSIGVGGIANHRPGCSIDANVSTGANPLTVNFDGRGSLDPEGQQLSYVWQFGDSAAPGTVTGAQVSHRYDQAGVYIVTLTVTDSLRLSSEARATISAGGLLSMNQPPNVEAGSALTIVLPAVANLDGTVTDDGKPNPPGAVTTTWSMQSGPGTVTFGNKNAVDTTATFDKAGTYLLRLTASDGAVSVYDEVTVTVNATPPANLPPTVNAGSDQTIALPASASLDGTVSDDGLPNPPSAVTVTWTKQSGPGTVTFGNANAVDTTAAFSQAGTYVLRLTASDGQLSAYAEVTITVNGVPPANLPPIVNAGSDQTISLSASASLDGTVSDDGLPNPPRAVTVTWTKQSGPGTVTFGNANAVDTTAAFNQAGTYVLRLTASDSQLSAYDEVTITVNDSNSDQPIMELAATATRVAVGETVDVSVKGRRLQSFSSWGVSFAFPGAGLGVVTQMPGTIATFVPDSRSAADITASGEVRTGGFSMTNQSPGNGVFGTVRFKATKDGTYTLSLIGGSSSGGFGCLFFRLTAGGTAEYFPVLGPSLTITVGGTNQAPTCSITSPANGATFTAPATIAIQANASDSDGTVAKVEFFNGATKLGEDTTSPYAYTWSNVVVGSYTLTAKATDNSGAVTTSAGVNVTVSGGSTNRVPVSANVSVTTAEDTAKTVELSASDPDGDPLTFAIVTGPAHGSLGTVSGSNVVYTPAANYNGTDSFTFKANDGKVDSAPATVSITVTAVNDAPVCSIASPANGATFTAPASITIQANASDVDGTIAKVEFYQGATKLGEDTTSPYAYTWSGVAAGSYTLTVKATDNSGAVTTSAGVNVVVVNGSSGNGYNVPIVFSGYNRAETLTNFPVMVKLGTNLTGFAYSQFLSTNGWDLRFTASDGVTELPYEIEQWNPNGNSFVWVRVPALTGGTTITVSWGDPARTTQQVYTTNGAVWVNGYAGVWHLAGSGGTVSTRDSTSFANHMVNNGLVAVPGLVGGGVTNNGASSMSRAGAVTTSTPLTLSAWIKPSATDSKVVLTLMANSTWDGYYLQFYSTTGSVVTAANTTFKTSEKAGRVGEWQYLAGVIPANNSRTVYLNGVAGNTESTTQTLGNTPNTTVIGDSGKGHWFNGLIDEARISSTARSANWIWAEYQNMASNAQFNSYGPVQGGGASSNRAPVAVDDVYSVAEDSTLTVAVPGVLSNDTDADGDQLSVTSQQLPVHGTLTLNANGSFTYTPAANYNGADSFTYRASDGKTNSNAATVTITVASVNDAPVCSITAPVNGATFTAPVSITIQANASDIDGTIAKVEFFNGATKLGEDATSPYEYAWTSVAAGSYALTVKATDNSGAVTTSAVVNVTVNPSGGPDGYIWCATEGGSYTFTQTVDVAYGAQGKFAYKYGVTGTIVFNNTTFGDPIGGVVKGGYYRIVIVSNNPPVANAQSVTTAEDTTKAIVLTGSDADGDLLTFATVTQPTHGTLSGTAPNVTYTPTANYNGTDSFTFRANDGKTNSAAATVSITVTPVNDQPVIVSCTATPTNGTAPLAVSFAASATDVDGDALTYAWNFGPSTGSGQATSYTYTNVGTYIATLTVSDGKGGTATASKTITVTGGNGDTDTTDDLLGTIAARGDYAAIGEGKDKAFDNQTSTKWLDFSPGGSWIQYAYAAGVSGKLSSYTITSANDAPERDPMDWQLLGSNDGGMTWTTVDSQTGQTFSARFQKRTFTLAGSPTYQVYRLNITKVQNPAGANSVQLAEIELIGQQVTVVNQPPVALAGVDPINGTTLDEYYFWGTDSYDPDGVVNSYQWTVNGTVVSTAAEFLWTFDVAGTYDVVLTVTDNKGASDSDLVQVQVTEPAVTVSVEVPDGMAGEPGLAEGNGTIRVRRTGSVSQSLTVNVACGGTASNGVDYTAIASTVVISAGAGYRDVAVTPLADAQVEGDEMMVLSVLSGTNYVVDSGASAGLVLIKGQTYGTPVVSAEATDALAKEPMQTTDKGSIKVSRTGSCHAALTVYCTLGGTAVNGVDYSPVTVPVVLAVGQSSKVLTIAPLADGVVESNETVVLTLTTNAAYQIQSGKGTATVTIQDATVLTTPVVSVVATDADAQEPAGGVLNYGYIRFARTTRFHETLTVNCTVGGTASNGVDYAMVTVPIVFAVGEGIKDVSIRPIADGVAEGVETTMFTLTAGTGYTVDASKASATVNIRE